MTKGLLPAVFAILPIACGTPDATDPLGLEAPRDVVAEAAPEVGNLFVRELRYASGFGQPCDQFGQQNSLAEWQIATGGLPCSITVEAVLTNGDPVDKGQVTFQYCDVKGGGQAPRSLLECQMRDGEWKTIARNVSVGADGKATARPSPYLVFGANQQGLRIKYLGQGSGKKNQTIEVNIVPGL